MHKMTAIIVALAFFGATSLAAARTQQQTGGGGKIQQSTKQPTGPAGEGQVKDPGGGSSKKPVKTKKR